MRPVLVTGASGMVGARLVDHLCARGVPVRVLLRPQSAGRVPAIPSVAIVRGDTSDPALLCRAVSGCQIVFHCACSFNAASAFRADGEDETDHRTILDLTRALLEQSRAAHVDRFVYLSSVAVYSQDVVSPVREDAPLDPYSLYGQFKVRAEALVRQGGDGDGMSTTIVRPCIIYGPGDRHFGPAVRALARTLVLPLPDGGRHHVDLLHVDDVVRLVCAAGWAAEASGQIYNAASGEPMSLRRIVEVVQRSSRAATPWVVPMPGALLARCPSIARSYLRAVAPTLADIMTPGGVRYLTRDMYFDISKAGRELAYQPQVRAADALAAFVR